MSTLLHVMAGRPADAQAAGTPGGKAPGNDDISMRTVIDTIAEGVLTLDPEGLVRSVNPAGCRMFGYAAHEIVGRHIAQLLPAEHSGRHAAGLRRLRVAGRNAVELPALHKSGSVFHVELTVSDVRHADGTGLVCIVRDISDRKRAADLLHAEKERLRVTLRSIGDAVISTNTAGLITYVNPVAEAMTGWDAVRAIGERLDRVLQLSTADGGPAATPVLQRVLRRCDLDGVKRPSFLRRPGGALVPIEESATLICDAGGAVAGVVLVFHDVSQACAMALALDHQASHDVLTGLINRSEFERRLQAILLGGQRTCHTLLYLDLDRFKIVNDSCGHVAGDELLRQVAVLLAGRLRHGDMLARLGGDEFGILLDDSGAGAAALFAESLRHMVADFRFSWRDRAFPVSVSIGVAPFSAACTPVDDVLRDADAACYVAKDKGGNRSHVHTADDAALARRRGEISWLGRIRKALDEQRFVLHAQHMQALSGNAGGVRHEELLVRMIDEQGILVPPATFIPVAERYGMMRLIDRWVIGHTCAGYAERRRRQRQPVCYAVNLSATSICDDGLRAFVLEQFARYQVPPQSICFEITETSAIANLDEATALMLELKAIGCRFALDDFGSGMASFSNLKHLPVDFLKIDGSFVRSMVEDKTDRAMVEAINQIGHVMRIQTIAEFAENHEILAALREMEVDYAQGYAIARPVPW
jgi:diguanylate cyclase (GGDEF)-like protein/PAS domain S-box-containing protein